MGQSHFFFITPTTSQPRYHRRIQACRDRGHAVTVCSFRRGLFEVNGFPPEIRVIDLGFLKGGNYLKRIIPLVRAGSRVGALLRGSPGNGILYCFGLDVALLGLVIRPKGMKLVYEVGDIIYLLAGQHRFTRAVMAALDRYVTRSADHVVLTSPGFVDHYRNFNPSGPVRVVENKVSKELLSTPRPAEKDLHRPIRIGFVGLFQYLDCLLPLVEFAAGHEGFEVHFFGDGAGRAQLSAAANRHPDRVFYHGPFRNPDDLPGIYRRIDFNYVVYDPDDDNVRVLTPNKLFESLFFAVPLIVAEGTLLAERVAVLGIGYPVDARRIGSELERIFAGLTDETYAEMRATALAVPAEELVDESGRLMDALTGGAAS